MEPNILVIEDHSVPARPTAPRWFLDQAVARILDATSATTATR